MWVDDARAAQLRAWVESATSYYSRAPANIHVQEDDDNDLIHEEKHYDSYEPTVPTGVLLLDKTLLELHRTLAGAFHSDACKYSSLYSMWLSYWVRDQALMSEVSSAGEALIDRVAGHMLAVLHRARRAVVDNRRDNLARMAADVCLYIMIGAKHLTEETVPLRWRDPFARVLADACEVRELILQVANRGGLPRDMARKWARALSLYPMNDYTHYRHPFVPYLKCHIEEVD